MPTHRTPTKVLETRGAFKRHPERKRTKEPKPRAALGSVPRHLTPPQKKVWREFVKLMPDGVLTETDAPSFEMLVALFAEFRADMTGFQARKMGTLLSLMGRFGLTPADRAKLVVDDKKPDDPWADFAQKHGSVPGPRQTVQ